MKTFTGHPTSPLAAIKEAEDGLRADGYSISPVPTPVPEPWTHAWSILNEDVVGP